MGFAVASVVVQCLIYFENVQRSTTRQLSLIFQNLNSHVSSPRANEDTPTGQSNIFSTQPIASNSSTSNLPPHNSPIKRARFCSIFARVAHISPSAQKPMSIPINNSLPSVCLRLGSVEDEENKIRMLLDTGATMNSVNLTYHL